MIPKQFRIHLILLISCAVMIIIPMLPSKVDPEKAQVATSAANRFLQLLDQGEYAKSWQASAALMQSRVTEKEWTEKLTQARARSGALVGREQKKISYSTTAHDSPDGEYILLVFNSSFQQAEKVEETLTIMLEEDNRWRVAGYFMQ